MSQTAFADRVRSVWETDHARLWRSLLAWSGSADVATEAASEAFAQLLRRGDEVRDPAAWVWRAAFRVAAGELHRLRRDSSAALLVEPVDLGDGRVEVVALINALGELEELDRQVVVLVLVAGWSSAEVAELVGSSAGAVRVRLHRTRGRLRELLEVHDE